MAFEYVPVLLGGVFKATGNASPAVTLQGIKNKGEYAGIETRRFLARHSIDNFAANPYFPVNTLQLMRGAVFASLFAEKAGFFERYVDEVYRHMWAEPKKMDDPEVMAAAFIESSLPVEELVAATQDPRVKQALIENTDRSVQMGTFGSPTFFVNGEIFFGKDKLRDVEEEILVQLG